MLKRCLYALRIVFVLTNISQLRIMKGRYATQTDKENQRWQKRDTESAWWD